MYRHLNPGQLKEIQSKLSGPTSVDVTGGMLGKVEEVLPAVEVGITVIMMNASKPGNICNVLQGKEFEGTLIGKE
jgi:isopentenyl phosphate kinase